VAAKRWGEFHPSGCNFPRVALAFLGVSKLSSILGRVGVFVSLKLFKRIKIYFRILLEPIFYLFLKVVAIFNNYE
jgi:hypothetical protein